MNGYFQELKATKKLPSPSGVALEILQLTQNVNVDIQEVVHAVSADPVLTGRVLKIVNSAGKYQGRTCVSVMHAVQQLGLGVLSDLALSLSILDINKAGECEGFDYNQFWSTSLLRALAMQATAQYTKAIAPEEAFTVGLVVEIGQLALAQIYPQEFGECLSANRDRAGRHPYCNECYLRPDCLDQATKQLLEDERRLFSIDHHQITIEMVKDWGLPVNIIKGIELFQQGTFLTKDACDTTEKLAAQLHVASILAGQSSIEFGLSNIERFKSSVQLDDTQLHELLSHLFTNWQDWKKFLNLEPSITPQRRTTDSADKTLPRILLVEDDRVQLFLLRNFFVKQGFEISTASNGDEALKSYLDFRPRIILTDHFMQPTDGITLCKTLRATTAGNAVYIMLLTADNSPELMKKAFENGVNGFITKPLNYDELNARLIGALRFINMHEEKDLEHESIRHYAFEMAAATRRMESLAFEDQLTGLPNRRLANKRLDLEWSKYLKTGETFAIFSLDLDHFKQVNDNYGHDVGDAVLVHFADVLKNTIRTHDLAARMGGEEFIVIAPAIDKFGVMTLGERLQNEVERNQPDHLSLSRLITVSIGAAIANIRIDYGGWEATLKRSDSALYAAKTQGRNRYKLQEDVCQRKYERIECNVQISVRRVSVDRTRQFSAYLKNHSKNGMFISFCDEWRPSQSEVLEVLFEQEWKIVQVVRLDQTGYAVESLKFNH
jgi:two-component system cell cycle response regulator